LVLLVFIYVSVFLLGNRRLFLSAAAALLSFLVLSRRAVVGSALLFLPLFISFSLFSAFRSAAVNEWAAVYLVIDPLAIIDPSRHEFGGWARIARDVLSQPFQSVFEPTFVQAPLSVVPSALWPERPDAPSIWYVENFDPTTASRGGAWAFSIVVESYMNFWYLGPFVLGSIVGVVIARSELFAFRRLCAVFVLTFSFRSDLVSLIQMAAWIVIFVGMFELIARLRLFR
jgi:hypothetical protein